MKVLIACEFSGIVREAFNAYHGVHAVSCDLLPAEDRRSDYHYQGDVRDVINNGWDMMIAFPPCTDLAASGAKWFAQKRADGRQQRAIEFVRFLMDAPIEKIAIENPVGIISSLIRKPDQIIQPWMFGHEATKTTCLWLKNLPQLQSTNIVGKGARHITKGGKSLPEWYNMPPSPDRWRERSRTFTGIAQAMAEQWSKYV